MNGLEEDFWGITIITTCIIIYILGSIWNTRENIYLILSVFMIFYISNALDKNDYNGIKIKFDNDAYRPFAMRTIPILAYIVTCLVIYSHDSSNYSKLSELIDQDNNKTREEKFFEESPGYWARKIFAIDFVMLVLFGLIVGSIYLDNSRSSFFYNNYKDYIQYVLIGGSIAMLFCSSLITLPDINKIINDDSTGN